MIKHLAFLFAVGMINSGIAAAQVPDNFWDRLALRDEGRFVLSIKYSDRETRARILAHAEGGADLPFINRVVVRIDRDQALSLQDDSGITNVEIFGAGTADRTFHKLLELYRVYLYQVSGRFTISALNFSQNVNYFDRNSDERGDQTIAEALDVIGSRTVPVLVAVGDGAEFGVGAWAKAPSVLPVVATTSGGAAILDNSARPERNQTPWRTVLYADGAPVAGEEQLSQGKACGDGAHLTANQMLHPETARIVQPGGSSFATFKATASLCYVHQYTELLRVLLRARTPIGLVEVEPFVAYYVDSPVNRACPALAHRWADQRKQFGAPQYWIEASDKSRLDEFVNGNSIELRPNYSIPLVKAFLNHLPEHRMTDSEANERYVSSKTLLAMLRRFHLTDLIEVAANSGNVRYAEWKQLAAKDGTPAVREQLVDAIESYCGNQSLFLVLSDKAEPFFDLME